MHKKNVLSMSHVTGAARVGAKEGISRGLTGQRLVDFTRSFVLAHGKPQKYQTKQDQRFGTGRRSGRRSVL